MYLYNRGKFSHNRMMIFESSFTFLLSLLLNDVLFFCCFVLRDVVLIDRLLAVIVVAVF